MPARQSQPAVDYRDGLGRAHQPRLEVGIAVAVLPVVQPHAPRDHLPQQIDDVALHALVPVLLNHDGGCRALGIDAENAVAHPALVQALPNLGGDIDQLLSSRGRYFNGGHQGYGAGKAVGSILQSLVSPPTANSQLETLH